MITRPITIICEIGINHNGNMEQAREMIEIAKECGADVAKFQIYIPERILDLKKPRIIEHWDIIKAAELSFENVCWLKEQCNKTNIEFLASVFHPDRVEWAENIGMERYKIASRSIYNKEVTQAIVATDKPIIASYGWYAYPRQAIVDILLPSGRSTGRLSRLSCVAEYPTPLETLSIDKYTFDGFYDGLSDHTEGITAPVVAMSLGAKIIEKHFTLSRDLPGCDQVCSMEPGELRQLCNMRNDIEKILWR